MSNASDRQHRITVYEPVTVDDEYGGKETTYKEHAARWAQVMPPTFREQQAQGAPMNREQIQIKLTPPDKRILRGWQIKWQDDVYEVDACDNTYRDRTLIVAHYLNPGE